MHNKKNIIYASCAKALETGERLHPSVGIIPSKSEIIRTLINSRPYFGDTHLLKNIWANLVAPPQTIFVSHGYDFVISNTT